MKYKIKIWAILLSICLLLPLFGLVAKAASGSLKVSSASGTVGSTVSITCTITCTSGPIGSADVVLQYDPAALQFVSATNMAQGGSGSVQYSGATPDGTTKSLSFTMKFKILKAGSHSVSVSSGQAYDIDEAPFSISGKGTVTGKAPSTNNNNNSNNNNNNQSTTDKKDSNNKLKSLQVYPGTMSPTFHAGTTEYTVTVPGNTTEVTISAIPQSSKAKVTVSGGKDLKLGSNSAQVIVVAESGASIAYNINIVCGEVEKISMNGMVYTIQEEFSEEQIPVGFAKTEIMYNERTYNAVRNTNIGTTLVCLQTGGKNEFFVYDETEKTFRPFVQVVFAAGKYIVLLPLDEKNLEFANHDKISVSIQGKTFDAWKLDDEFCVLNVVNQEGREVLYCYDELDDTFQRYKQTEQEEISEEIIEKAIFPNKYYMYAIVGLGALSFILFSSLIYFIASRKKRRAKRKIKAIKKIEKQKRKEEKQAQRNRS